MPASWKSLSFRGRILRAHALLWWALIFPIAVLTLAYTSATNHWKARALLEDHSITQAVVAIDENGEPSEHLARFKYTFEVDGKTYDGTFATLKANADKYPPGSTLPIAYANFDPSQSQRPDLMESNADLGSEVRQVITMSGLAALLIGLFFLFLRFLIRLTFAGP